MTSAVCRTVRVRADRTDAPRIRLDLPSRYALRYPRQVLKKEAELARKTVLVSDISGSEIPDGKGATVRITYRDARKGVRELDVTDDEAEKLGGRQVARRGRRPKAAAAG
jgi:hypothetical protein